MSKSLTDIFIADSYQGVIHLDTLLPATGTAQLYDGVGSPTALFVGRDTISVAGILSATNIEASAVIYTPTLSAGVVAGTNINGTTITGNTVNGTNINGTTVTGNIVAGTNVNGTTVTGTNVNGTTVTGTNVNGTTVTGNTVFANTAFIQSLSARSSTVDNILIKGCTFTNNSLIDKIYPVGSVYFSVVATNPTSLIGGIWESIATGKFVVGVGSAVDSNLESKTFVVGNNDGEYAHELSVGELPPHTHTGVSMVATGETVAGLPPLFDTLAGEYVLSHSADGHGSPDPLAPDEKRAITGELLINSTGSGEPYNQTPPSFGMYMWKRIQ